MIRDLRSASEIVSDKATVVIVGGGVAGLVLAERLTSRQVDVLVLESGDRYLSPDNDVLNEVEQGGLPYRGALEGRRRALGGTSTIWGGAMLPFLPCDLESPTAGSPVRWPVAFEELEPYFPAIERLFHLPAGDFALSKTADDGFVMRSAKWPTFDRRNVATLLSARLRGEGLRIWTGATVTKIDLDPNGRATFVEAHSKNGHCLRVACDQLVIAAGAIETTRLMLQLQREQGPERFVSGAVTGRYFQDHISVPVARIVSKTPPALNNAFGLRFVRGGMRDVRLEPGIDLRRRERLPGAFAHVAFESDRETGFAALREIYRDLQSARSPNLLRVLAMAKDTPWFMNAVWWRFIKRRLLAPSGAHAALTLVMEQYPNPESRITLSTTQIDRYGAPIPHLSWRLHDIDFQHFEGLQSALIRIWPSRFGSLGELEPLKPHEWRARIGANSDVFHPVGSTRMATQASEGVVDGALTSFDVPNLHLVSTSTFPSGGGANPTFMLLAFALRKADQLAAVLS